MMKIIAVYLFCLFGILLCPHKVSSQMKKDFKVYNALLYKNTPDLSKYGFSPINVIYEDGVITTNSNYKRGEFNWRYIDFKKVLQESQKSKNENIPVVLDVEYWGHLLAMDPQKTNKNAEDTFVTLLNLYREIDDKNQVAIFHYGVVSKRINNAANVVFPSFYTHSSSRQEWVSMIKYWLDNLKKTGNKNPIYVFIWPQYNPQPGLTNLGFKFIDINFWRFQLETLYPLCDGIVIWSHKVDENGREIYFNEKMPWFQETLKFMKKYNIK